MTTETQPQAQQEQPDDSNNIWRMLGRLEANQQTMLQRMDSQEQAMLRRMDRHDASIVELGEKVTSLEANQQTMLQRMDRQDDRMDRQDDRMDRLEAKMDSNHRWTVGLLLLILIAVIGSNWLG